MLSLAAGALPEFPPDQIVAAASEAGFSASGIWCDTKTWTAATTRAVARRLRDGGLIPLDIEVVWMGPGRQVTDDALRLIDIGGELGAQNVLIVSANPDPSETTQQFAVLCERAQSAGMRAVLEFLMIAQVRTLAQALEIVTNVGHPAAGLLIDALHLARCGALPEDVARIPRALLPYAQLCDGAATLHAPDFRAYLADAMDGRLAPGEGELPLRELLRALPETVSLSLEVRSKRHRERFPDPVERARAILRATERFLSVEAPTG